MPANLTQQYLKAEKEYRSAATLFGLPLVHIASSRDPEGKKMKVARGIIAIGDVAIGGIAIGGFSFGGITLGGINVGLIGIGGLTVGLLTAIGGIAAGGFAAGGLAGGIAGAQGAAAFSLLASDGPQPQLTIAAWLIATIGFTIGAIGAFHAWGLATRKPASS